ncbi:MAG: cupin domain-containing protein [Desulfovibrio sp.]|nr:cupin domain-containing protein [Desulfovibrio sp.]
MRKISLICLSLVCVSVLFLAGEAVGGEKQVFTKKELKTWDREKVAGGEGILAGKFSFTRNDPGPAENVINEIGWMTLQPGHSIGMHQHRDNEDAYLIIFGEGVFTDSEGKETVVTGGDVTIARAGQSHALKNTGNLPLIFLDIVAKK